MDNFLFTDFKPPDYNEVYIFRSELGIVKTLKVDIKYMVSMEKKWEEEVGKPSPPLIPVTIYSPFFKTKHWREARVLAKKHKNMSRMQAAKQIAGKLEPVPVPDPHERKKVYEQLIKDGNSDEEARDQSAYTVEVEAYDKVLRDWGWRRFIFLERILYRKYTLFETDKGMRTLEHIIVMDDRDIQLQYLTSPTSQVLDKISTNADVRVSLYTHYWKTSQLTWEAVLEAAEMFGTKWKGRPVLATIPQGSGDAQSIIGQGIRAAHSISMPPQEYMGRSVTEQAQILAQYLIEKWLEVLVRNEQQSN